MAQAAGKVSDITPDRDKGEFWADELTSAKKLLEQFHTKGTKIVQRYLDDRKLGDETFRLNLFHSNIQTMQDTMYANLPKVETNRRNADSADDVARVASSLMERLLNLDLAKNAQKYDSVLRSVLQDRLLPGLGVARVRYECEYETQEVPAQFDQMGLMVAEATTEEVMTSEDAPVDYYHWQDVLWGWARNFSEVPWIAYRSYPTKAQCEQRFGEKKAKLIKYKNRRPVDVSEDTDTEDNAPNLTGEIWEIWDKESKTVRWVSNTTLLDRKADPLQLQNFFPSPAFLMANATTTLYRPVADYYLCQDLYVEIDGLQSRISTITEAVKVVGVYEQGNEGVRRMLEEGTENDLIPVDNWAMFAEKGGLKGVVDWLPLEAVVNTLDKLRQLRDDTIGLLQQVSGMADVQQGSIRNQYEGVGQTQIKAQYGSIRVQALQDQFACFAADLMQLKAEVICRHFEIETIAKMSNAQFIFDANLVPQALQLLKQPDMANIRIIIRPETIAMIDYAKLKADRGEFIVGMATYMQSAAPLLQQQPGALPLLLKVLQWNMAGYKGSQEIEGVLDQMIEAAVKEAQNPQQKPDPEQQKSEAKIQEIQADLQADLQVREADKQADIATAQAASEAKLAEINAGHQARMEEILAKAQSDMQQLLADAQANMQQSQVQSDTELEKTQAETILEAKVDQDQLKRQAAIQREKPQGE